MTVVIKQYRDDKYYINLELSKEGVYTIEVCQRFDSGLCGYPIQKAVYPISEKKNAEATFRRYVKRYGSKGGR